MSTPLMHAIDSRSASALASGDLVPVQSEQIEMDDGGMRFRVLWVASLAAKDATAQVAIPGGPRDPGRAAQVSLCKELGLLEAQAYNQVECFAAGVLFARHEGIVPAPESNHAVKAAIEEALRCKREGKSETILFCLSGHGHFDMASYQKYFAGELSDESYSEDDLAVALAGLPKVPA